MNEVLFVHPGKAFLPDETLAHCPTSPVLMPSGKIFFDFLAHVPTTRWHPANKKGLPFRGSRLR